MVVLPLSVVIGNRNELFARGLAALLSAEADLNVCDAFRSTVQVEEFLLEASAAGRRIDVALLGWRMSDTDGAEAARRAMAICPHLAVVLFSSDADDPVVVEAALDAGCSGLLGPEATLDTLVRAVRLTPTGEAFYGRAAMSVLVNRNRTADGPPPELSPREREVLQLLANGVSPAQIALDLRLSLHTVRNHIRRLMARLDTPTRLDAVVKANRLGLISLSRA